MCTHLKKLMFYRVYSFAVRHIVRRHTENSSECKQQIQHWTLLTASLRRGAQHNASVTSVCVFCAHTGYGNMASFDSVLITAHIKLYSIANVALALRTRHRFRLQLALSVQHSTEKSAKNEIIVAHNTMRRGFDDDATKCLHVCACVCI